MAEREGEMANEVYVNIKDNHFKVWGYDCFVTEKTGEAEITTYWGKIGLPLCNLQSKKKSFSSSFEAREFIWKKIGEKIDKGYNSMPNWQYFGAITDKKPMSQLIGLIEVYQQAQDKAAV